MDRPRTRGDCKDGPRPCPWVSCAHHMAHIVPSNASRWTTKSIVRDDEIDPEDVAELIAAMEHSCALDIADRGEHTLEQIGEVLHKVGLDHLKEKIEEEGPWEQTLSGGAEMAPGIARQVKAHFDAAAWKRSDRLDDENPLQPNQLERQVLQWTCDGFLPHEIARDLRISTREVAQRVRTLYRKLHLDRRTASLSLQLL